jgi:hypothetical protein
MATPDSPQLSAGGAPNMPFDITILGDRHGPEMVQLTIIYASLLMKNISP